MKTLIIYTSQYGTTEKCAQYLADKLSESTDLLLLDKPIKQDCLNDYDAVIIGSSIRVGMISKKVKTLLSANKESLQHKKIGLFLCCGQPEESQTYLANNFDKNTLEKPPLLEFFFFFFNKDKMGFFAKGVINAVSKGKNTPEIDWQAIDQFILDWQSNN